MLHPTEATWTPSGEGYARLSTTQQLDRQIAATNEAIAVSSAQNTALFEHSVKPQASITGVSPVSHAVPSAAGGGLYSMDTAMMALALLGAWMVVVGGAMLSRRVNQIKTQPLHH